MKSSPLVSVIIPTYKRSSLLIECIDSVLNQSYDNIEILVIDDNGKGTSDQIETERILSPYIENGMIKYIPHEVNKNGSAARNTGLAKSHGEYVLFLDDDDTLLPRMIYVQLLRLLQLSIEYGAVYCNSIIKYRVKFFKKIRVITTHSKKEGNICLDYLLGKCRFNTSTILFRRQVLDELKGFDESFIRHQDYELMVRFFNKYRMGCSYEPLVLYDKTKDKKARINIQSSYEVKKHFFSKRGDILTEMNIYREVAHFFYLNCAISAYLLDEKELYKICRKECLNNKKDSLYDFFRLNIFKILHFLKKTNLIFK